MTQPDLDSWKPPALREAEAQLDVTMAKARDLIKKVEEKLAQLPDVDRTAKPEDIQRLKSAAERPDASAELRALKKKVNAGELTWKDVLEGKALKDPVVREAMRARLADTREIYQEAAAGASLEEILEARGVTGSVLGGGEPTGPQSASTPVRRAEDGYPAGGDFRVNRPPVPSPLPAEPPAPGMPPPVPPVPHRSAPRARPADSSAPEDDFGNPLASREQPKRPEPPRRRPEPPRRRARTDEPPDDDDYFGGSVLG